MLPRGRSLLFTFLLFTLTAVAAGVGSTRISVANAVTTNADLAVLAIRTSKNPVSVGDIVEYFIDVKNNGPANVIRSGLTMNFPSNLHFLGSQYAACGVSGSSLLCPTGTLNAGQSRTVRVILRAHSAGVVTQSITIVGIQPDPNSANNSKSVTLSLMAPGAATPKPVTWTSAVGVSVSGNSLTKSAPTSWGNAGAISSQRIPSGDGYVQFNASETSTYRMIGLSKGNSNASFEDIDFAVYLARQGQLKVYEAGKLKGTFGSYLAGDTIRIAVVGSKVKYSRNGVVFYTSTKTIVYPLRLDSALYDQGATLTNVVIYGAQ